LQVQQSFAHEDKILKTQRLSLLAAICFTAATAAPAFAQAPHPEAAHAISDLRAARDILSRGGPHGVTAKDQQAIALIDKVIFTTNRVQRFDENRLRVREDSGVDATASNQSRHENARIMMAAAMHDLDANEVDPSARPYLQQARYQLGEAIEIIRRDQGARN
jgi:hypothetical protein